MPIRPAAALAGALLTLGSALPGLSRLEVDNSPRAFFVREDRMLRSLDELRAHFGGGPAVRMAWSGEGLWTDRGLGWLRQASREAAAVGGVAAVHGPLDLDDWWRAAESPTDMAVRLREDPWARGGGWVNPAGDLASIVVELDPDLSRRRARRVLGELEDLVAAAPGELEGFLVGLPVIERAMDRSYEGLVRRIFPAVALVCTLILALACRNGLDAILPLLTVGVAESALIGAMGWAGVRFNLITSILLPIVFVLGLVASTHLQMRFRAWRERGLAAAPAATAALRDRAWAIFWGGLTTAIAFGSFAFSRVPAVRVLGLCTATGVVLTVVAAFVFQVPVLALFGGTAGPGRRRFDRFGRRLGAGWARRAASRRLPTLVALVLVGGVAAAGLPRLVVETGLLGYFPPAHPVPAGFTALTERGVGAAPAEIVLRLPGEDPDVSFRDPERLERLAKLTDELRAESSILGAVGAGDLFRAAGRRVVPRGPSSERMRWLVLGLLQTEPDASRRFERLVTADGQRARVTLLLPVAGQEVLLPVLDRAVGRARTIFPEAEIEWTGEYPLVLVAQRDLLATMARALGLTLVAVTLTLVALLRSPRTWAAAMAANLWPLLVAGGVMGWLGVPLDSTTVMIASVALGIAVDDTLHTLGELRRTAGRVGAAIAGVAPAQLLTTVILGLGFLGCGLSDFLPIARFGLVTAAALLAALAGDWLLLPALLGRRPLPPAGLRNPVP